MLRKTSLGELLFKLRLDPSLICCKEPGRNSGDSCSTTPTRPMKESMIEKVREIHIYLLLARDLILNNYVETLIHVNLQ